MQVPECAVAVVDKSTKYRGSFRCPSPNTHKTDKVELWGDGPWVAGDNVPLEELSIDV